MKHAIAIFASGSGTNAENIIRYFQNHDLAEVKIVISSNSQAFVVERAQRLNVPCEIFNKPHDYQSRELIQVMEKYEIEFIVLAGFMWLIPPQLIKRYPNRIVNIHPALLPKYGGKGMYGDRVHIAVSNAGETESGITIHYVNENYDEGDIIFQAQCEILPGEEPRSIAEKVHQLEYEHYPKVIEGLVKKLG